MALSIVNASAMKPFVIDLLMVQRSLSNDARSPSCTEASGSNRSRLIRR